MSLAHDPVEGDDVERIKAVVRRVQAALAPSLFAGKRPSDAMIVNELATMLRSAGVIELLRQAPPNRFTDVIGRAQRVLEGGGSHAVIINTLWRFIDEAELNEALQTDDKDEAPRELVRLMLEGPYKLATAH
jgi:hypothetical protein